MNIEIELAKADDDPAIRRLLAANPIPGRITLAYEREPNYFLGCGTMGRERQVLVARDRSEGVVGVACRAVRPMFVNGQMEEVGYLGQLRVDDRFRGRWLVSNGFRFLHKLHDESPVGGYLVSLIEENREALAVLIDRRRKNFPVSFEVGRLCTLALIIKRKLRETAEIEIERGSAANLPEIVGFLRRHGANRQFYPAYDESDFCERPTTLGFCIEDFVTARRDGEIIGVIGLWDQSSYKQTIVKHYASWLGKARPFYNATARVLSRPSLPAPGQKINYAYASFICVTQNESQVFQALLRRVSNLAAARGYSYLMIGFEARDPLLTMARNYPHIAYHSRLFLAGWEKTKEFYERLDDRVPYIEIAAL